MAGAHNGRGVAYIASYDAGKTWVDPNAERYTGKLIHRMTDDLTPAEFYHVPVPGANCAAWVIGHLTVTLRRTAERLDATVPMVSLEFVTRFTQSGKVAAAQTDLGDPAELMQLFDQCLEVVITSMRGLPPAKLDGPTFNRAATAAGTAPPRSSWSGAASPIW